MKIAELFRSISQRRNKIPSVGEISSFESVQFSLAQTEQSALCTCIAEIPSFESVQFSLARTEQGALCNFFHLIPPVPAASLRSVSFSAGALFVARMTLRRSAFRGFQIRWFRNPRNVNLIDLVESFPTSAYFQISASIQPRTIPWKFAKGSCPLLLILIH